MKCHAEASYNPDMIDKAAIFTELTRRNAVRRQAQLPLLDTFSSRAFVRCHPARRLPPSPALCPKFGWLWIQSA